MPKPLANTQVRTNILGVGGSINTKHEGGLKRSMEDLALKNVESKPIVKSGTETPMANPGFGTSVKKGKLQTDEETSGGENKG